MRLVDQSHLDCHFSKGKTMKKIIAVAASALFMTGAFAQTAAPAAASAPGTATSHPAKTASSRVEKQINELHNKLKITAAEEGQWANVAQVMRDNATQMDDLISKRETNEASMTAVDHLNSYGELAQAHADGVKKVSGAFEPLYNSMPDAQKKIADTVFRQSPRHTVSPKTKK
jgi:periplasmic protein CpxP/Spy